MFGFPRSLSARPALWIILWAWIIPGILIAQSEVEQQNDTGQEARPLETFDIIPDTLDFGRVFDGDSPVKTVVVKNKSDSSLTVRRIGTTCGCAIPRIVFPGGREVHINEGAFTRDLGVLGPGEEARIDVSFTTWGYKGILSKRIDVQTDALHRPRRQITVLAEIIDSVKVEPQELDLGEVVRGQHKSGSVTMQAVGIGDFTISGIKNLPPYLTYTAKKLSSGPDASYSIHVETREDPPLGEWSFILQVAVVNAHIEVARFPLKVKVVPKVNFKLASRLLDDEIDMGVFNFREGKRLSVDIVNLAPQIPYIPEDLRIEGSPFITYHLETIREGELYRLDVEVQPDVLPAAFIRSCLTIQSDHPDLLRKELNIIGWASQGG